MALLILVEQADLRNAIKAFLETLSLFDDIHVTNIIEEATKLAEEHVIDMFIVDVSLNNGKGRDFMDAMRSKERYQLTWTIMLGDSEESCREIIDSYNTSICHRFIMKPFELTYLGDMVIDLTGKKIIRTVDDHRLRINRKSVDYFFDHDEIVYAETVEKMAYIYTTDNKQKIGRVTLSELETRLNNKKFVRVHRSYIINTDYIDYINKENNQSQIKIKHYDHMIPVGRTYKNILDNNNE